MSYSLGNIYYKPKVIEEEKMTAKKDDKPKDDKPRRGKKPKRGKVAKVSKKGRQTVVRKANETFAEFMDKLVQRTIDPKELKDALRKETERRGLKSAPTLGTLRAHVRFRQSKGQLTDVVKTW